MKPPRTTSGTASAAAQSPSRIAIGHWTLIAMLLTASIALFAQISSAQSAQTSSPHRLSRAKSKAMRTLADARSGNELRSKMHEAELLDDSREAGLLTDWHLDGRFGSGGEEEFAREFAPEKEAANPAAHPKQPLRYELVFPEGRFVLPPALAASKGVFYVRSSAYLSDSGEWNVYLESAAEAVVFVDGQRVLDSGPKATGVRRGTIHAESGYHTVMVKFTAQAAPFRVAILPPNSGSRRKNNTPYLEAAPASEDMMAKQIGEVLMACRQ